MQVFTYQHRNVLEAVAKNGFYRCKKDYSMSQDFEEFDKAYSWLVDEMAEAGIERPCEDVNPIWAYYIIDGKNKALSVSKAIDPANKKDCVLLSLEIDPERVQLTDMTAWDQILLGGPVVGEDDDADAVFDALDKLPEEEQDAVAVATWKKAFDIGNARYVQATFWEIRKEDIVAVKSFN